MNKISIIVPVYNTGKFLNRCYQSIAKQTYSNLEIIFIDDSSPDDSSILLEKIAKKDPRVRIITHSKNKGLSESRNTGIANSTGEYLMFVDSDDYIIPNACKTLINLSENNKLDLLIFGYLLEGWEKKGSRKFTNNFTIYEDNIYDFLVPSIIGELPENMGKDKEIGYAACSFFINKRFFNNSQISYISERDLIYEDYLFAVEIAPYLNKVGVLDYGLYVYCHNEDSLTNSFNLDKFVKLADFIKYVRLNISIVNDNQDNVLRFQTTMLNYLRNLIIQANVGNAPIKELIDYLSNKEIRNIFELYPINRLPKKYNIFFSLMKRNSIIGLCILKLIIKLK